MDQRPTGFSQRRARHAGFGPRRRVGRGKVRGRGSGALLTALASCALFDGSLQAATTDILWRNGSTGSDTVWLMQGDACNAQDCARYGASASILSCSDPNWKIVGSGDFNGDGQTDIVWRHYGTGMNGLWLMNGTTYLSTVWLPPARTSTGRLPARATSMPTAIWTCCGGRGT